ncbi:MAG: flagellar motor protein MotB [Rhodospirillaceae bacterium]|jgi:chemotaxis protein MotB|nr:flagellar motor protein MotB [Rhodospirillaceae bacterium]
MPPPPPVEEPVDESWLATYADAITLLMAFFVMLLTFAEFDIPAYEEAAAAIASNVAGQEQQATTTQDLKLEIEDVVFEMAADQAVEVSRDSRGVTIEMKSGAFFKPGSAELRDKAIPVLEKMALLLAAKKYACFNIEVEGHTDDVPIKTALFPSNWELSAARASRVTRYFITQKLQSFRFRAIGLADTDPKVPNRDLEGKPIRENQATNRRIQLRLERMNLEQQKRCDEKGNLKAMLKSVGQNQNQNSAQEAPAPTQAPAAKTN